MNKFDSPYSGAGSTTRASNPASDSPHLQPRLDESVQQGAERFTREATEPPDSLAASVKQAARTTTRAVQEQARDFAANVGHELGQTAEHQKQRGVEAIQGLVRAVNTAASELEQQSPRVASYVRDAADKVEQLSSDIGNRDVHQLLKSASDLARSQPLLFLGGAIAAGFAMSRFLKSSAPAQEPQPAAGSLPGAPERFS